MAAEPINDGGNQSAIDEQIMELLLNGDAEDIRQQFEQLMSAIVDFYGDNESNGEVNNGKV